MAVPARLFVFLAVSTTSALNMQQVFQARIAHARHTSPKAQFDPAQLDPTSLDWGRDPRFAPPWITENDELLAELAATSEAQPKPATASRSPAIRSIQTLEELEIALETALATGRILAVKYYAPWCQACFNTKPLYEDVAHKTTGEIADFYECDLSASRVLCTLSNIEKMPCVHLYAPVATELGAQMQLTSTWLIESRAKCAAFAEGLIDLHLDVARQFLQPEIPPGPMAVGFPPQLGPPPTGTTFI